MKKTYYRAKNGQFTSSKLRDCLISLVGLVGIYLVVLAVMSPYHQSEAILPISEVQASPEAKFEATEAPKKPADPCTLTIVECKGIKGNFPESAKNDPVAKEVYALAKETGFKWPDYAIRIIWAESRFNPLTTHKNTNGTTDRGLWQWNTVHKWMSDKCAFDVRCSTLAAFKAINEGHQSWWVTDSFMKHAKY